MWHLNIFWTSYTWIHRLDKRGAKISESWRTDRYIHKVIHRCVVQMDLVHHTRVILPAQVNDVNTSWSCSNSSTLGDRTAGQTFCLNNHKRQVLNVLSSSRFHFFSSIRIPFMLTKVYFRCCESDLSFKIHDTEEIAMWGPQLQFSTPFEWLQPARIQILQLA